MTELTELDTSDMTDAAAAIVTAKSDIDIAEKGDHLPSFDGEHVIGAVGKVSSSNNLDFEGRLYHIDSVVKLVVEAKVLGIAHRPNKRGELERVYELKAIDAAVIDWAFDVDALREAIS